MSSSEHVQSVRNAWVNRVRDEALRVRRPEVSKCFHVGMIIASYADADGGNSYPLGKTIGAIAGCSEETVSRCVRLLMAVGLLERRRRPNNSSVYQLVLPIERPDWDAHMAVWGESRQAKARKKAKAAEIAELLADRQSAAPRNPSGDAVRNPSGVGVPEPVPGGGPTKPETRPGTGTEPVRGRSPEPVLGGGDHYPPTYGRDPDTDHTLAGLPPQPQDACARVLEAPTPPADPAPTLRSVPAPSGGRGPSSARAQDGSNKGQMPLLMPVRTPPHVTEDLAALRAAATEGDIRRAITELGRTEAVRLYGLRLTGPLLLELDTHSDTGT